MIIDLQLANSRDLRFPCWQICRKQVVELYLDKDVEGRTLQASESKSAQHIILQEIFTLFVTFS